MYHLTFQDIPVLWLTEPLPALLRATDCKRVSDVSWRSANKRASLDCGSGSLSLNNPAAADLFKQHTSRSLLLNSAFCTTFPKPTTLSQHTKMADNYQQPTAADADADGNEVPNEVPAQPKSLNIKFTDTSGTEVHFKLKSTTKLKKAMDAYSARIQRDRQALRFLFDGDRVMDDSTPESVSLTYCFDLLELC